MGDTWWKAVASVPAWILNVEWGGKGEFTWVGHSVLVSFDVLDGEGVIKSEGLADCLDAG